MTEPAAVLDGLYEGAPVGLGFWDEDLRYRRVNARLAEINGLPAEAHIGRRPSELLGEIGTTAEAALRRVLETRSTIVEMHFTGETPAAPGRTRHWLASFYPVPGANGAPAGVGGVVIEVTDRYEAAEREHAALREAETARAARGGAGAREHRARVLDAHGADPRPPRARRRPHAGRLLRDPSRPRRAARPSCSRSPHVDSASEPLARELGELQVSGNPTRGPAAVIRSGRPEIYPVLTADPLRPEAERLMRELCFRSAIVLPLVARGAVLGTVTLLMGTSGRHYDDGLIEMAESLAALAGLALDNARLFAEQTEVAAALQRTLLPSELPQVPGAELAARYRAAGRSNQVGGDFYDVLPAGERRVGAGDRRRRRQGRRGGGASPRWCGRRCRRPCCAATGRAPRWTLVDEALRRRSTTVQFCSALHGRMRPAPGRRIRSGAAVRRAPAAARPAPRRACWRRSRCRARCWASAPTPRFGEVHFHLAPGDVLLLYTDGATELRGGDPWRGETALRETLLASAGIPLAELVERVEHEALVLSGGELRDDLALLAVGAAPPGGE